MELEKPTVSNRPISRQIEYANYPLSLPAQLEQSRIHQEVQKLIKQIFYHCRTGLGSGAMVPTQPGAGFWENLRREHGLDRPTMQSTGVDPGWTDPEHKGNHAPDELDQGIQQDFGVGPGKISRYGEADLNAERDDDREDHLGVGFERRAESRCHAGQNFRAESRTNNVRVLPDHLLGLSAT